MENELIKELEKNPEIIIISGEGNQGTIEKYTGTKTARGSTQTTRGTKTAAMVQATF